MEKFEYKTFLSIKADDFESMQYKLTDLGLSGWELIGYEKYNINGVNSVELIMPIFKKRIL